MGDGERAGWFPESLLEDADTSLPLDISLTSLPLPLSLHTEAEPEFVREERVVGRDLSYRRAGGSLSLTGPRQASRASRAHLGPGGEEVGGGDGRGQVEVRGRGGGEEGRGGRVERSQGEPQLVGVRMATRYKGGQTV